jgi:peptidylprolyl isomerase
MKRAFLFGASIALFVSGCPSGKNGENQPKAAATGASAPSGPGQKPAQVDVPAPPDVAAPPADAEKTASGLASKVIQAGTGTSHPEEQDSVQVKYTGWTTDGKMFDSTDKHGGQPTTFPLKGVIPGWTEGLQLMVQNEKRRFWIPENLAYKGQKGAPAGMLVFDVELLNVMPGPKPLPAPEDVAAPAADAKKTKSGLAYKVLQKGTGKDHPGPTDRVKVQYTGWTTNGKMFDSSVQRGMPAEFSLDRVIPGWTEAIQLMVQGEKSRFWIPEELAYKGRPGMPQGMLVFEVELQSFTPGPKPIPVPEDVKAPPASAKKTSSGLAYKVLHHGKSSEHPAPTQQVRVHYTGWTTDGKQFDSSVQRGQPATFTLNQVIPGWTEGVQLMSPGDKFRIWIPEALAYKGQPGAPPGMLVFDVELLDIVKPGATPPPVAMPPH